ncbi:hypothetical protein ACDN41_12310 [Priestia aryabhattai]|uniref:hypothetical protein n=1 Tax=Priestia aryabhattai TaxID=412384 RepID=UPI0035321C12
MNTYLLVYDGENAESRFHEETLINKKRYTEEEFNNHCREAIEEMNTSNVGLVIRFLQEEYNYERPFYIGRFNLL